MIQFDPGGVSLVAGHHEVWPTQSECEEFQFITLCFVSKRPDDCVFNMSYRFGQKKQCVYSITEILTGQNATLSPPPRNRRTAIFMNESPQVLCEAKVD